MGLFVLMIAEEETGKNKTRKSQKQGSAISKSRELLLGQGLGGGFHTPKLLIESTKGMCGVRRCQIHLPLPKPALQVPSSPAQHPAVHLLEFIQLNLSEQTIHTSI